MRKYEKLGIYLKNQDKKLVKLTFEQIEKILGFPLPKSARTYRPWWANDKTHVQAKDGWLNFGWKTTNVDMGTQIVSFVTEKTKIERELDKIAVPIPLDPFGFETHSRYFMSEYLGERLFPAQVEPCPKIFDMVSDNKKIVGDAKYMTMGKGKGLPTGKFSNIAETVWLLEKINAEKKFIVFGNDKNVPIEWLRRYNHLVSDVTFYFLNVKNEKITKLN